MSEKLSLLVKKLHDELEEYCEMEKYGSTNHISKIDRRYALSARLIAMTEAGDMDLDEEVLDAMLEIDGVLDCCWDIAFEDGIPTEQLFRELMNYYKEGEVW